MGLGQVLLASVAPDKNVSSRFDRLGDRKNTEKNIEAVSLQVDLSQAFLGANVIESYVCWFPGIVKSMLDPIDFLSELGIANSREPNPNGVFVDDEETPAPSQQRFLRVVDLLQIDHLESLEGRGVDNNDRRVDRCEIQLALVQMAVMYRHTGQRDPSTRFR